MAEHCLPPPPAFAVVAVSDGTLVVGSGTQPMRGARPRMGPGGVFGAGEGGSGGVSPPRGAPWRGSHPHLPPPPPKKDVSWPLTVGQPARAAPPPSGPIPTPTPPRGWRPRRGVPPHPARRPMAAAASRVPSSGLAMPPLRRTPRLPVSGLATPPPQTSRLSPWEAAGLRRRTPWWPAQPVLLASCSFFFLPLLRACCSAASGWRPTGPAE